MAIYEDVPAPKRQLERSNTGFCARRTGTSVPSASNSISRRPMAPTARLRVQPTRPLVREKISGK